ncbi:MAG: ABC transporter permease [Acidobacteriota bacterium]
MSLLALAQNRYLISELIVRDIRSRYVGSIIGIFWSILNPLLQLLLYTLIFSVVLNIRFGETASTGQFAAYLFAALLPWMAVQESVTRSSRAFIENANLIKKLRFPLEVLPFSVAASAIFHQLLGSLVFALILLANGSLRVDLLPLFFILLPFQILLVYGLSLSVACLNVFFRDIAQILGVLFMLLFWITPIVYPKSQAERAPAIFGWILNINPFTHLVEIYRFVFLGSPDPSTTGTVYWILFGVAAYYLGHFILTRTRGELLDLV